MPKHSSERRREKTINRFSLANDFLHLVFPEQCLVCSTELSSNENSVCSICEGELTLTHFESYEEASPMDQLFWGRVQIDLCYAHFYFEKNKASQYLLFNLKYGNNDRIGEHFGKRIGKALKPIQAWQEIEAIIPVPLHPKKEFIRGYNQSMAICKGLSEGMDKPINPTVVQRSRFTESQTTKSRFDRWDNVASKFEVSDKVKQYRHVVLVDDVITTGSTLEAIVHKLRDKHAELKVSIITLAIAK